MGYTAHFNPSTLKVAYKSATSKVQMVSPYGVDCAYCTSGLTPKNIVVRIENVNVNYECCNYWLVSYKIISSADPNGDWVLPQVSGYPCVWEDYFGSPVVYYYDQNDCAGDYYLIPNMALRIRIEKISSTALCINVSLSKTPGYSGWQFRLFGCTSNSCLGYFSDLTINDCMNLADTLDNDCTVCHDYGGSTLGGASGGTLKIKEGTVW